MAGALVKVSRGENQKGFSRDVLSLTRGLIKELIAELNKTRSGQMLQHTLHSSPQKPIQVSSRVRINRLRGAKLIIEKVA